MGGAALASILHLAGRPSPSHRCCPIVVIQLPSSYHRPQIATVVVINIVALSSSGKIVTISITVAVAVAVSTIAIAAVIVNALSTTLLHHHCCRHAFWRPIGGAGLNHSSPNFPHLLIVVLDGWRSTCRSSACRCHPSPSHCCHPIVVVKLPLSNHHPQIAAVVAIDIVAVGSRGGIIAFAVALPSPSPPLPLLPSSSTLLC
jgi:hypothetical protein